MGRYLIGGGNRLNGEVRLQGSKNASLPIMAASVLNGGVSILHNVPDIEDVRNMKKILISIGCKIYSEKNTLTIDSSSLNNCEVSEDLVSKMRSSVMLMGALISKFKKAKFSYPGGCEIGLRPIDIHIKGLKALGALIEEEHGYILIDGSRLKSASVLLNYPSVGATENLILASIFNKGVTSIHNAAKEPEIIDLQNYLNTMGARVYGAGTNNIYIEGVEKLHDCEYFIMPDRVVLATYLCALNITGGKICIKQGNLDSIKSPYYKLIESGMKIKSYTDEITAISEQRLQPIDTIITQPYPGFPTDMQPLFTSMLTYADGTSIVKETVFENRYKYISQLMRMGADVKIDGRLAIIKGVRKLSGAKVYSQDLRGGAALVIAALGAEGYSMVEDVSYIERGYENLPEMMSGLGADIRYIQ